MKVKRKKSLEQKQKDEIWRHCVFGQSPEKWIQYMNLKNYKESEPFPDCDTAGGSGWS